METIWQELPLLGEGLLVTLQLVGITSVTSVLFACALAVMRLSTIRVVRGIALTIIEVFRGVPLIAQLLVVYFALGSLFPNVSAFWVAVLVLTVCESAYVAEVYRGAIMSVGSRQWDAADSLGLTTLQAYRLVVIPQSLLPAIPITLNLIIWVIKGSALASLISVPELTKSAGISIQSTFQVLPTYFVILAFYLALTIPLTYGVRAIERAVRVKTGSRAIA